jgi:ArsR family transcriptional regulator
MEMVETLKALADQTRLRMVGLLSQTDVLCACEIEAVLGINQSNASRHLARLRNAGIVRAEKDGHWMHYSLDSSSPHAPLIRYAITAARAGDSLLRADLGRLEEYQASGFTCQTIDQWRTVTPQQ